jgi:hypothetical protein
VSSGSFGRPYGARSDGAGNPTLLADIDANTPRSTGTLADPDTDAIPQEVTIHSHGCGPQLRPQCRKRLSYHLLLLRSSLHTAFPKELCCSNTGRIRHRCQDLVAMSWRKQLWLLTRS